MSLLQEFKVIFFASHRTYLVEQCSFEGKGGGVNYEPRKPFPI